MDSADQVVFVLELILALGPLAVYFLGLGLVNSQARPCLVRARADFTFLAIAFVPIIIAPVLSLIQNGLLTMAATVVVGVSGLFFAMLPRRDGGWVIYNLSPQRCRMLLERACRRLDWGLHAQGDQLHVLPPDLRITLHSLPVLGNVTLRIESATGRDGEAAAEEMIAALRSELDREEMLPSATGASLVLLGAGLLGLPVWYLFHHLDAIVEVVRRILFA